MRLAWDRVDDDRVAVYQLSYGTVSGQYDQQLEVPTNSATVGGLLDGQTYFFAVRACDLSRTVCSGYSNEISDTLPAISIDPPQLPDSAPESRPAEGDDSGSTHPGGDTDPNNSDPNHFATRPAPVADFTLSRGSGAAPLIVTFTDTSTGKVETRRWDLGDGTRSQSPVVVHTYRSAGIYAVSLTVTGSGGLALSTKTLQVRVREGIEMPVEVGEFELDHVWRRVDFEREFKDPIVVVKPLGGNAGDPAVVRVQAVDGTGFWVRLQEWDYLDDWRAKEPLAYLAIERGTLRLPTGAWVEAGRVEADASGLTAASFAAPFVEAPVVLTTVTSVNDRHAVVPRLRDIDALGFRLKLQEQEANLPLHALEIVDYIAWEPSTGDIDGLFFEAGRTADAVTHRAHAIRHLAAFDETALFISDLQSSDGSDTASLRWSSLGAGSVEVWVEEEQSKDSETRHTSETVGYLSITDREPERYDGE